MEKKDANKPTILKKHLIYCEGIDAKLFLIRFLNCEHLKEKSAFFSKEIQVVDFGGNSELIKKLPSLVLLENFDLVESLLIIRDAEKNAQGAIDSIRNALKEAGLPIPKSPGTWEKGDLDFGRSLKVGFLLFPTCNEKAEDGQLEDLCISILHEKKFLEERIDPFLETLKEKRNITRIPKTRLHTYFSVSDEFVSLKIGEAANKGVFDWKHDKLKPLSDFILEMQRIDPSEKV